MWTFFIALATTQAAVAQSKGRPPIPDKLIVLTFDDSAKTHFTVARPLLLKHKFGATFFVTEGFDFPTNKRDYMTWDEIAQLHRDGFEIGNHTRDHMTVTASSVRRLPDQIRGIADRCREYGIPVPTSFAYPGNGLHPDALPLLHAAGIRFARRGGAPEYDYKDGRGCAFEPGLDHPLLLPSTGDARPHWTLADFRRAIASAKDGKIAILQFHGVPDTAHHWVNTQRDKFEAYIQCLADGGYRVIAMRELARYMNPAEFPKRPWDIIEQRRARIAASQVKP